MSAIPCSVCRQRPPGKRASAYWAWFNADGSRSAWRLRYCLDCAPEALSIVSKASASLQTAEDVFCCLSCGTSTEEDSDPMYLTLYLPSREQMEFALQLDGACAARLRIPITEKGERLPDRSGVVRGPSPSVTAWDALGLSPSNSI
jgi:hypothetical protein